MIEHGTLYCYALINMVKIEAQGNLYMQLLRAEREARNEFSVV